MAIVFKKKAKKQRNLAIIFVVLLAILIIIVWQGGNFIGKEPEIEVETPFRKIKIDFALFENESFKRLKAMDGIPDFEGDLGKDNPFIP